MRGKTVARNSARLPEIKAAQQLAHDQDVRAAHHLLAQRRTISDGVVGLHRTQVGESAKRLPQRPQPGFGTHVAGAVVVLARAYCAQQHGIRFQTRRQRLLGQRSPVLFDGVPANAIGVEAEIVATNIRHRLQNSQRLARDLRANAITGQYRHP